GACGAGCRGARPSVRCRLCSCCNAPPSTEPYTLSLHDALPISAARGRPGARRGTRPRARRERQGHGRERDDRGPAAERPVAGMRSEEHTSELQSPCNLVCRLLLEKKKTTISSDRSVSTRRAQTQ